MKALHLTTALGLAAALFVGWAEPALASQHHVTPTWKIWWDWSWRIINFLVLAFLIYKAAKKPLAEFLTGQRAQVAAELEEVDKAKAEAEAELKAIQTKTAGMAQELKTYEQALSDRMERERERLLGEAREESEMVMHRAELQADMALQHARQELTHDIVELAAELAESKLKEAVSHQDQESLFDKFADGALNARGEVV